MAFPGLNVLTLEDALKEIRGLASRIRAMSFQLSAASAAAPVAFSTIDAYLQTLKGQRARMQVLAATPGIVAYAQAQCGDVNLNISTEYAAMLSQVDLTITWIAGNLPKDASGYLLAFQMDAQGAKTERTFSTAALAALRTRLDALIATISG